MEAVGLIGDASGTPVFVQVQGGFVASSAARVRLGLLLVSISIVVSAGVLVLGWATGLQGALVRPLGRGDGWVVATVLSGWVATGLGLGLGLAAMATRTTLDRARVIWVAILGVVALGLSWLAAFVQGFVALPLFALAESLASGGQMGLLLIGGGLVSLAVGALSWPGDVGPRLVGVIAATYSVGVVLAVLLDLSFLFGLVGVPTVLALLAYGASTPRLFGGPAGERSRIWLAMFFATYALAAGLSAIDFGSRIILEAWIA